LASSCIRAKSWSIADNASYCAFIVFPSACIPFAPPATAHHLWRTAAAARVRGQRQTCGVAVVVAGETSVVGPRAEGEECQQIAHSVPTRRAAAGDEGLVETRMRRELGCVLPLGGALALANQRILFGQHGGRELLAPSVD
jgi:hypothetical protein